MNKKRIYMLFFNHWITTRFFFSGETTSDILRVATEARKKSLGPFNPSFNIHQLILEGLEKFLPDDAHIRVSGKLHISLTRVCDGKYNLCNFYKTNHL